MMEKETWKLLAIVLAVITLLETAGIIWIFKIGMDYNYNDNKCSVKCSSLNAFGARSYTYYDVSNTCMCNFEDGNSYTPEDAPVWNPEFFKQ